ncbi:MAG: Hint domain-containing protein [Paracoccaceae bacterium]
MPFDRHDLPAHFVPVYRAGQFCVTDGANLGDTLSVANEILLGDSYALDNSARLTRLRIQADFNDGYRVDASSCIGTPGNVVHLDCVVTLMSQDGDTTDVFVLVEVDSYGDIAEIYLLPIATLTKKMNYAVVIVDKETARQKLAQAACVSFTKGTRITTASGAQVAIENLGVGDRVLTRDDGYQDIRWIGQNTVRAVGPFAPIRITAGTFSNERDLVISPDHRVFLPQHLDEEWLGRGGLKTKARLLVNGTSVQAQPGGFVDYYQLLFDSHQMIFAEGIAAESLHIDPVTRSALPQNISHLLG